MASSGFGHEFTCRVVSVTCTGATASSGLKRLPLVSLINCLILWLSLVVVESTETDGGDVNTCEGYDLAWNGLNGGAESTRWSSLGQTNLYPIAFRCGEEYYSTIDRTPYVWYIDLEPNFKFIAEQETNDFDSVTQLTWAPPFHGYDGCRSQPDSDFCVDDPDSRALEYVNKGSDTVRVWFALGTRSGSLERQSVDSHIQFRVEKATPADLLTTKDVTALLETAMTVLVVGFLCCCLCICGGVFFCYRGFNFLVGKQKLLMDDDKDLQGDIQLPAHARAPSYWENQDLFGEEFDDFYSVEEMLQPTIQQMFVVTWKDIVTRDRKGGQQPVWLEVTSVQRFEDQDMYASYYREKERIRRLRSSYGSTIKPVRMLDGDWNKGKVLTDDFSAILAGGEGLDESVNEHFLFHGTSPEAAANIAENGFRINLAGSNAGTLFGKGAYFAECSSKADEYATTGHGPIKQLGRFGHQEDDEYAILICRVCMGEVLRCFRSADKPKIERMLRDGQIDSVLGDREEAVGTYREFIVYREAQIYPEYRVLYKRRFAALE